MTVPFYEFIIIFLLFILFISMLYIESLYIFDGNRPDFFYEGYVKHTLRPRLNKLTHPNDMLELAIAENNDTQIFIWRQTVFMSFFISFFTMIVLKIFFLSFPWTAFILLFISVFFTSFLLLCLITYHYYNQKSMFVNECLHQYRSTLS